MNVPIMGVIYQPTDIDGVGVSVQAVLQDYYYRFNLDDTPSMYYAPSDVSANASNDSYNPWKSK